MPSLAVVWPGSLWVSATVSSHVNGYLRVTITFFISSAPPSELVAACFDVSME